MKKKILFILAIFLFPIMCNAYSIKSVTLEGDSTAKKGDYYNLKVIIHFDGIDKNSSDSMGIFELVYDLDYDRSVFIPTSISPSGYTSVLYYGNGNAVGVLSVANTSNKSYLCKDETLICSDYEATINYYVEDTDKSEMTIKLNNIDLFLLPVSKDVITESDVKEITAKGTSKTIKIIDGSNQKKEVKSIVEENKPKVETPKVSSNTTNKSSSEPSQGKKSSNNYLSSLSVEGYEIEFKKTINDYSIFIEENVKKVEVKYTLDDEKAKVTVHGNENLQNDNSVIVVTVTAENGSKNIYKINVKKNRKVEEEKQTSILNKIKDINKKPILIIAAAVLFIFIIVVVVSIIKSHKIDKTMDKF